ncbi:MAG: hypothetical protein ACYSX1_07665, partial [Planctomycetota bacterium]
VPLPYDRVQVPDPAIQALVDSSIRNIWQAREIKDGLPAFQVGPTIYRGLWIVDGAFLLEAAAILGAGDQARSGVAYEMKYQQPDGSIRVIENYHKENGIVLWTCVRHAQLTQDKAWLESMWPNLERIAEYIKQLRRRTYKNDSPLDDGLNPAGFPDGGIGGNHYEYTNSYWNLLGLRSFIQGARWLGKNEQAAKWQEEYDDFMAATGICRFAWTARTCRNGGNGLSAMPSIRARFFPPTMRWLPAIWRCSKLQSERVWFMVPAGTRQVSGITSPPFTAMPGCGKATGAKQHNRCTHSPITPHRCWYGAKSNR